ncbi:PREDICTED: heat stress transcription factor A-3 isoform X2 [Tarenaya hassleriana]|uniref:heat stress transcription factor A-3 isoform X2 n=1 Tax=Tarenaya hassleriana TaxID=28532 RepID=UPI0008FD2CA8|nr:PREDICTED: heat stress transcription factor A-3 isoform X2 [Tarenaya hassleriana]
MDGRPFWFLKFVASSPRHIHSDSFDLQGFRKIDSDRWEFANEAFRRGKKHLLKNIHRRRLPQSQQATTSSNSFRSALEVGAEIENLRKERKVLIEEVVELQQQHRGTARHMDTVNQRLQAAEQRQKQMLSFLAKLFQNPSLLERLRSRRGGGALGSSSCSKMRRKFIKHQQHNEGSKLDSPTGTEGQLEKYTADDTGMMVTNTDLSIAEEEVLPFPLAEQFSGQGASSSGTGQRPEQYLDTKGKDLMNPPEEMMNSEYFASFPSPGGLYNVVKQEEIWNISVSTMPSSSNTELWSDVINYEFPALGPVSAVTTTATGGLSDVCWDLGSEPLASAVSEFGFNWPTGENPSPDDNTRKTE